MPNVVEWSCIVLFAAAWPLYEHAIGWPRFLRQLRAAPERARLGHYRLTIVLEWVFATAGLALWVRSGRPWAAVGMVGPTGWRLWTTLALVFAMVVLNARNVAAVVRSARTRTALRARLSSIEAFVPHTRHELNRFLLLSITAGFCEEFLFRGFLMWALTPWLTWWGAALASSVAFALGHTYLGRDGALRAGVVGLTLALIYGATGSLLPGIALHALIDLGSGLVSWIALQPDAPDVQAPNGGETGAIAVA